MKRIKGLPAPTAGIVRFRAEEAEPSWESFRDFDGGKAYAELANELARAQEGLCAYCEIGLRQMDRQVEHVVPRSDMMQGAALSVEPSNLVACCAGGTNSVFGKISPPDLGRYLPPVAKNQSCGQAKGDSPADGILDPRNIPLAPSLFRVTMTGQIEPDAAACDQHGIEVGLVEHTIKVLGLDVQRLRNQRAAIWKALSDYPLDIEILTAAAQQEVLADSQGNLRPFFTTNRSFFGELAEMMVREVTED